MISPQDFNRFDMRMGQIGTAEPIPARGACLRFKQTLGRKREH